MLEDFIAAYDLKSHKDCNGQVGVVGFCFGGWIANMMAVKFLLYQQQCLWRTAHCSEAEQITTPLLLH
jgi:carboxymethylenebutenolidase